MNKYAKISFLSALLAVSTTFAQSLLRFDFGPMNGTKNRHIFGTTLTTHPFHNPIIFETDLQLMPKNVLDNSYVFAPAIATGVELRIDQGFYARFSQGIAYVSKTFKGVETNYQFPTKFSTGIWAKNFFLGINFTHYSNGSTHKGNTGINFFGMESGFSL